jgi:hypothetical protein
MTDAQSKGNDAARARLRGKRIALVVVIAVAVVFIGASAVQIVPAVFGAGIAPMPSGPPGSSARLCAEGVRSFLDVLGAPPPRSSGGAKTLRPALAAEPPAEDWDRVAHDCASAPGGEDAWAALMRLRSVRDQLAYSAGIDLDPLRRDVAAHLPADLR